MVAVSSAGTATWDDERSSLPSPSIPSLTSSLPPPLAKMDYRVRRSHRGGLDSCVASYSADGSGLGFSGGRTCSGAMDIRVGLTEIRSDFPGI